MAELTVQLRTLTPLWTGGVDGTMDRIHETVILGSLRWWFEAIVRGLGGNACDPTKHTCELSGKRLRHYETARKAGKDWWTALNEAGICDACKVFGTTGWRRRFRLEVHPVEDKIDFTEGMFPSGRVHPDKHKPYRVGGWLLRGGYLGTLELRFTGDERILLCEILPTLLFIEQWGALGPKTSIGYGVIEITEIRFEGQTYKRKQAEWRTQLNELVSLKCQESRVGKWWFQKLFPKSTYQGILPALTNMFFGKVRFEVVNSNWWKKLPEIQWLQNRSIPEDEAHWTEQNQKPQGPYGIHKSLPVTHIEHWIRCHNVFPVSPIIRTRLRYGLKDESSSITSICNENGDSYWCKFVFGTVDGRSPICGYCGFNVRKDKNDQNRWWCKNGKIFLTKDEIIPDEKRIQSKLRISWAYRTNENEWEFRLWGWLPEHTQSTKHQQQREDFLNKLKKTIDSQLIKSKSIKEFHLCCFVAKSTGNNDFHIKLLNGCKCEEKSLHNMEDIHEA